MQVTIVNWKDHSTLWSGVPDKLTLGLAVYDARSGKKIS